MCAQDPCEGQKLGNEDTIFPPISYTTTVRHEFKQGYSRISRSHAPTVLSQTYTPKTLAPFNGKDGGWILLTMNGIVFGVTAGHEFYRPGAHALEFFWG